MKPLRLLALTAILALPACATQTVQRYGSLTELRPEKAAYYRDLHAHPWPGVLHKLKQCNIRNYSIFEGKISGHSYLFSYFEYTGKDFAADMKAMAADSETRRWWKETDPCQRPLPDAAAKGKIWSDLKPVFYMP